MGNSWADNQSYQQEWRYVRVYPDHVGVVKVIIPNHCSRIFGQGGIGKIVALDKAGMVTLTYCGRPALRCTAEITP